MWLKSLFRVPLGPLTMTVRPFSDTVTGKHRQTLVTRLRGQHHNTPFARTRRRTLLRDVNGLVAENGLHSAKDNRKMLHTLSTRPFLCALPASPPHVSGNAQLRSAQPRPPPALSRHRAELRSQHRSIPPRPQRRRSLSAQLYGGAQLRPRTAGGREQGKAHPGGLPPTGLGTGCGGLARRGPGKLPVLGRCSRELPAADGPG